MKNLFFIALAAILLLSFTSCKKAQNHIYGKVTDMTTGEAIDNAEIDLYLTEVTSNGYSGSFSKFMSTVSDSEGNYSLEFEPKAAGEYKLKVSKKDFHTNTITFMPQETAAEYEHNITIPKAGYIHYKIHNAYGAHIGDESDVARIKIDGINPLCTECASSDYISFEGLDVNEEGTWNIVAGEEVSVSRVLIRNGSAQSQKTTKVICNQGETIEYTWNY